MQVTSQVMTITPELAKEWLRRNVHNRNVRLRKVSEFAGAMQRNEWTLNGEAIKFDRQGNLADGQHRLLAIADSGHPIDTLVVWGVEPQAQETMDRGTKRSVGDALKLRGEGDQSYIAAVTRYIWGHENGVDLGGHPHVAPTSQQLLAVYDRDPEGIRHAATVGRGVHEAGIKIPGTLLSALYYVFKSVDPINTDEFFARLRSGLNLSGETDPIYVLRRHTMKVVPQGQRQFGKTQAAIVIKAFNAWREGRPVRLLRFVPGGAMQEQFPAIEPFAGQIVGTDEETVPVEAPEREQVPA